MLKEDHPLVVELDRRRRVRKWEMVGGFVGRLVRAYLEALAMGWLLMLGVGVAHHEWIAAAPTIGFGPAMLLGVIIRAFAFIVWLSLRSDD